MDVILKKGLPREGELVIVEVVKINPNSVFVGLKEYDAEGMIHISEVSRGWIKDVRHFVKIGQDVVARVLRSDEGISLSLKRVSTDDQNNKMKSYRLELRAEKLLELAGQSLGLSPETTRKEMGEKILDEIGSIYEVFKMAVNKPQQLNKYIPEKWFDAIVDVAKKNIIKKDYELKAKLLLETIKPNGIGQIKDTLKNAQKMKLDVRYISAPEYLVKYSTKDPKRGMKELEEKLKQLVSENKDVGIKYTIIDE